ncbi:hypothetical protein MGYG_06979 [Nannizzia gypsea CBS 118893]|uniref:Uncharacterized protein n=1 Tax=Arthroderma gypseum (strain ATCC MYA-4604 / CBS 118893) TaxID=535722 RepID=E4V1R1_ARTGP|nr:hypothetical protein MGYG_06979 [Nannizzia gypsea CBS 118893]EFR03976.1 hypothetical protein MGYG_06979 [Nannizzia gypsea CBS 118893]
MADHGLPWLCPIYDDLLTCCSLKFAADRWLYLKHKYCKPKRGEIMSKLAQLVDWKLADKESLRDGMDRLSRYYREYKELSDTDPEGELLVIALYLRGTPKRYDAIKQTVEGIEITRNEVVTRMETTESRLQKNPQEYTSCAKEKKRGKGPKCHGYEEDSKSDQKKGKSDKRKKKDKARNAKEADAEDSGDDGDSNSTAMLVQEKAAKSEAGYLISRAELVESALLSNGGKRSGNWVIDTGNLHCKSV